ncbi:Aste57867_12059 [Aphanomyces stellatus]|uniref:Aste57867_12059 protein n=1 Tax=Aphanomyces stellatus TaxID=120398 RepID=A0A485KUJ9_9STRA|nr:hypothetical protein As57867_012014 [Aphanomyces stellatus]VFT88914.1 Aste57867_12059 [Aphanomyces stellatus]
MTVVGTRNSSPRDVVPPRETRLHAPKAAELATTIHLPADPTSGTSTTLPVRKQQAQRQLLRLLPSNEDHSTLVGPPTSLSNAMPTTSAQFVQASGTIPSLATRPFHDEQVVIAVSDDDDDDECPATQHAPVARTPPRHPRSTSSSPSIRCPTCSKNLTFLNERGQLQHVNACLDQLEQFECNKLARQAAGPSRTGSTNNAVVAVATPAVALMPCKVCGIELAGKTTAQRVNHLKQCGRFYGVNVQQLITDESAAAAPPPTSADGSVAVPAVPTNNNAFDLLMKNAQTASMALVPPPPFGVGATSAKNNKKRKPSAGAAASWTSKHREANTCPQYKLIRGTSIVVDGFQYANPALSKVYFLTHFHSDHYMGLTKSFSAGIIYCTPVTAKLVLLCLGVNKKYVHPLAMNQPHVLPDQQAQVTFIEANHCPGAALVLFQVRGGKTYLHTGDFRYDSSMLENRHLVRFAHQEPPLDAVYLDTTYCEPQYCHPTQAVAIAETKRLVDAHAQDRALFLFGSYSIGKERLYMDVAHHLRRKVFVERSKYSLLSCFDWPASDMDLVTMESSVTNLHVVPMGSLNFDVMAGLLSKHRLRFQKVIAFQPTGWTFSGKSKLSTKRMQANGNLIIYGIPYSEHSSFEELCAFVKAFKPTKIIPTVNCAKSQKQVDLLRQTCFHNITHHFK